MTRPFGTLMDCQQSATSFLFTGKMQDAESGLAHFHYRKYASLEARWLTPDPAGNKSTCPHDPQSQDRYAYTGNEPNGYVDCGGLFEEAVPFPVPEPFGLCEPDDYTIDIDGMEAPPCPYLLVVIQEPVIIIPAIVHLKCIFGCEGHCLLDKQHAVKKCSKCAALIPANPEAGFYCVLGCLGIGEGILLGECTADCVRNCHSF